MTFERVAPGLRRLSLLPFDALNVYLAGDVLVDSGTRFTTGRLLSALKRHPPAAHVVSHCHPDHQGGSQRVCLEFRVPLLCGEGDRPALETGDLAPVLPPGAPILTRAAEILSGAPQPVSETLLEGDMVSGFQVLETPGHTPGHLSFWRSEDRVLILGDVLFHRSPTTFRAGLSEPFRTATRSIAENRASARRLAALQPDLVCFGHGAPLADGGRFREFVSRLPQE